MEAIPTSLQEITPRWITGVLHQAGMLRGNAVASIRQHANAAFNSCIAHLELTYAEDSTLSAPRKLLIKLNDAHNGESEVAFYRTVMERAKDFPMLVRCYGAAYDASTGYSYCLLHDLSDSHTAGATVAADDEEALFGMIDALAQFHALWWEQPFLDSDGTGVRRWYADFDHYQQHIERRTGEWQRFSAMVGNDFPQDLRALYEHALAHLPRLWERYLSPRVLTFTNMTVTNGDCYTSQFLCPKDARQDTTYIVDFQDVSGNFGPYDLVYLIATWFTPEQRQTQQREIRLLQRYHKGLLAHGVATYPWETMLLDYQLMLTLMLFDPIWNATSGSAQSYWWPKLQCLVGAFRDWQCDTLFDT